jgi:hypothetical protein
MPKDRERVVTHGAFEIRVEEAAQISAQAR